MKPRCALHSPLFANATAVASFREMFSRVELAPAGAPPRPPVALAELRPVGRWPVGDTFSRGEVISRGGAPAYDLIETLDISWTLKIDAIYRADCKTPFTNPAVAGDHEGRGGSSPNMFEHPRAQNAFAGGSMVQKNSNTRYGPSANAPKCRVVWPKIARLFSAKPRPVAKIEHASKRRSSCFEEKKKTGRVVIPGRHRPRPFAGKFVDEKFLRLRQNWSIRPTRMWVRATNGRDDLYGKISATGLDDRHYPIAVVWYRSTNTVFNRLEAGSIERIPTVARPGMTAATRQRGGTQDAKGQRMETRRRVKVNCPHANVCPFRWEAAGLCVKNQARRDR